MSFSHHIMRVWLAALLGACASNYQEYPVRTKSEPLTARDARISGTAPAVAADVTAERLTNARSEPRNWLTYYGAYDAQRFSALDQIDTGNISRLRPAWTFQHPVITLIASLSTYGFEAAPIVVDGVMYVSGFDGYVWALDAASGRLLWQYQHSIPVDVALCCGNINRGVAVANGLVYLATLNAHLVALDARSGKKVWEQIFGDMRAAESATLAPLVVKDLVVVGASGAEYGVRGHLDAFDARTGAHRWRRYTVPKPGEPGSDTWPKGDAWATGGGAVWITGSYDAELDLMYWGTGNPGPVFHGSPRAGSNLFTNSVIAVDPDDGTIRWFYQFTPHDVWDYDGVNEMILFERGGRKLLAHFDKNGFLFVLDRTDGALVRATPFGRVTWGRIDETTGRVTVLRTPTPEGTEICPGPAGAKEWSHAAFSPETGLFYVPVIEACATFKVDSVPFREGMPYFGGGAEVAKHPQIGYIKAIDPGTGREVWSWRSEHPMVGSLLATAGGLVFAGAPTGELLGFDARSGRLLWRYQTGSGIHGNPVTYSVNGIQYVAVPSGWGGWLKGFAPELLGASRGSALFAFALP
ncbi:MAG TPA: PQQ-dependent dehydrogenase, methanol/ethanol family [Gemmatimonadales bacterium]|nr:PQQ-dependent dehydrogenase, methanol/ethanol family [Gemmatimonadales bacterium]